MKKGGLAPVNGKCVIARRRAITSPNADALKMERQIGFFALRSQIVTRFRLNWRIITPVVIQLGHGELGLYYWAVSRYRPTITLPLIPDK